MNSFNLYKCNKCKRVFTIELHSIQEWNFKCPACRSYDIVLLEEKLDPNSPDYDRIINKHKTS